MDSGYYKVVPGRGVDAVFPWQAESDETRPTGWAQLIRGSLQPLLQKPVKYASVADCLRVPPLGSGTTDQHCGSGSASATMPMVAERLRVPPPPMTATEGGVPPPPGRPTLSERGPARIW